MYDARKKLDSNFKLEKKNKKKMLMDQKQLCDSMIDEKNKLINDFKQASGD